MADFFLDFPATLLYLYTNCSNVKNQLRVLSSQIFDPKFSPLTFSSKIPGEIWASKSFKSKILLEKKIPPSSLSNFPPLGSVNFQGGKNWVEMQKIQCEIMFYWRKTTFHWMAITRLGLHSSYLTSVKLRSTDWWLLQGVPPSLDSTPNSVSFNPVCLLKNFSVQRFQFQVSKRWPIRQ